MNFQTPTDHTGFYTESDSEREERFATLAGAWETDDRQAVQDEDDDFEYHRELARYNMDRNAWAL